MSNKSQQKEELKPNYKKIPFIPAYLLLGCLILYLNKNSLIYYPAYNSFADMPRLLGCIAFSFLGFAFLVGRSIRSKRTTFPWTYLWYYPVICCLGGTLVFSACQFFERTSGYLFYFIAFPLSFISGILVDSFWVIILARLTGGKLPDMLYL